MEPLTHQNSCFCWKQFFPNCKFWKIYLRLEGVRTSNATVLVGCVFAQALTGSVILGRFLRLLSFWSPCSLPSACLSCCASYFPAYALEKLISPLAHKLHSLCLLSRLNFFIKKKNPPCLSHVDEMSRFAGYMSSLFSGLLFWIYSISHSIPTHKVSYIIYMYFLSSSVGKRICLQCRRPGFDTWVGSTLEKEMGTHRVHLPQEFHGQRSLVGYSPWDHKEMDTTVQLTFFLLSFCYVIQGCVCLCVSHLVTRFL